MSYSLGDKVRHIERDLPCTVVDTKDRGDAISYIVESDIPNTDPSTLWELISCEENEIEIM